jgi:peptidoglycan/LPS O-acetylase OafA/YrhL
LITRGGFLAAVLSNRWIVWMGTISYGLYLWHFPIYRAMSVSGFGSTMERLTIGILITFMCATASYYVLERYFLRLKTAYV